VTTDINATFFLALDDVVSITLWSQCPRGKRRCVGTRTGLEGLVKKKILPLSGI